MSSKSKISSESHILPETFFGDMYEDEIRGLRAENEFLKLQQNALVIQINDTLAQLQTLKEEQAPFNTSQKGFFELSPICNNGN